MHHKQTNNPTHPSTFSIECPVANCEDCVDDSIFPLYRGCRMCKQGFNLFRGALNDHCYTSCPPQHFNVTEKQTNSSICASKALLWFKDFQIKDLIQKSLMKDTR